MEGTQPITEQMTVAMGQPTTEQLQQGAHQGIQSVLNLRSPQEDGFWHGEPAQAQATGLEYANIPVSPDRITEELADQVLQSIDQLPKPVLIHCKSGLRSGAIALMHVATRQGLSAEQAMEMGQQHGFNCDASPRMKQFFQHYIKQHHQAS
ncbi:beta-lactamase hydrolase domain-containing protein [Leptolyngbya sp. AN02str]|uniref:beta-lactamase hydrolase domain-containing protein n=1 Tax=Leptolyngbya sp. AN02str TaxID=3423363 RepID=UPI003D319EE3